MREVKMRCSERKIGRHQGNGRGAANGEKESEMASAIAKKTFDALLILLLKIAFMLASFPYKHTPSVHFSSFVLNLNSLYTPTTIAIVKCSK